MHRNNKCSEGICGNKQRFYLQSNKSVITNGKFPVQVIRYPDKV